MPNKRNFFGIFKKYYISGRTIVQESHDGELLFDTLAQAMSGIVYAAEQKEIDVTVDCPHDLLLFHDVKWTVEVLFNLLDNVVKYTPAGGKIRVGIISRDGGIYVVK